MTTAQRARRAAASTCARKVPYVSRREARAAASRMSAAALRPYTCQHCGQYHLTSMSRGTFKRVVLARSA